MVPAVAVVLAAAAAGTWRRARAATRREYRLAASSRRSAERPPTVSVAILNASGQSGAAKTLAERLAAQRVDVTATGNVTESRAPGYWILYANGAKTQAEKLAAMLKARAPTLAPIDANAQAAAGPTARVVVLIT